MSMPITFEWVLVTEGNQERVPDQPNSYKITLDGYHLFPIEQTIEIKRHKEKGHIGFGEILELRWHKQQTTCIYRLTSLQSVN